MEDKQRICYLLCETLQNTRNLSNLFELRYDKEREVVIATFGEDEHEQSTITINVALDSGTAMIKDIIRKLGY